MDPLGQKLHGHHEDRGEGDHPAQDERNILWLESATTALLLDPALGGKRHVLRLLGLRAVSRKPEKEKRVNGYFFLVDKITGGKSEKTVE